MKYTVVYWRTVYVALPSKLSSDQQSKDSYLLFIFTMPQQSPHYQWSPRNLVGAHPHPLTSLFCSQLPKFLSSDLNSATSMYPKKDSSPSMLLVSMVNSFPGATRFPQHPWGYPCCTPGEMQVPCLLFLGSYQLSP